MAKYKFSVIMAVYNMVKVRGMSDYSVKAVRSINLTAAIVSILSLHTALLAAHSPNWTDNVISNAVAGTVVCALIVFTGLFMIFRSLHKQKELYLPEEIATDNIDEEPAQ